MKVLHGENQPESQVWAIIPARGGSKSIPLKNLVQLGGRPLINYVIGAARASKRVNRIICSTENDAISKYCKSSQIEVHRRSPDLAKDDTPITPVLIDLLRHYQDAEGVVPLAIVLLQPTSPFVTSEQIDLCVDKLTENSIINSVQTVTPVSHNQHAYNQRMVVDERVKFRFEKERSLMFNKQKKPAYYSFGNLVVTRALAISADVGVFAEPSLPIEIPRQYSFDLDTQIDVAWGNYCLSNALVDIEDCR